MKLECVFLHVSQFQFLLSQKNNMTHKMHIRFCFKMGLKFKRTIVVAKNPFKGVKNNGIVFMGYVLCNFPSLESCCA